MNKKVLVIIPTYNEAENISQIIKAVTNIQKIVINYIVEILVIDDNSPDGTAKLVTKIMKDNKKVTMILGQKTGLGKAYLRGFAHGLSLKSHHAFIMMDADFSHDPKVIPSLLNALDNGSDYVIGSRYVQGGSIPGNWPLLRIVNSRFANFIARNLIGIDKDITDLTGGFKALRVKALMQIDLDSFIASGYFFQVNLLHSFLQKGLKVTEVPITFADRQFGVSKLKFKDVFEFMYRAYMLNPQSQIRKVVRFCIVGLSGTIVNLFVLTILIKFSATPTFLADAIAIEVSIISNFIFNNIYTFRSYSQTKDTLAKIISKLVKFNIGTIGGALISFTVFNGLYYFNHWNYLLADVIGILIAMSWNYWMSTKLVWKVKNAVA